MNAEYIFILFMQLTAVLLFCYAVYREKDLIKFERKAWFYIKAFFKALVYTLRDFVKDFLKAFRAIF